jgi:hypothetical protein
MIKSVPMSRKRKLLATVLTTLFFVLCLYWAFLQWQFKGDGKMSYLGPFAPSYRIVMAQIPLNRPGDYRYAFTRLPAVEDMGIIFKVAAQNRTGLGDLAKSNTALELSFLDEKGNKVCSASGTLGATGQAQKWVVLSDGYSILYNVDCIHFSTRFGTSYTLVIRMKNIDPHSSQVPATPMFEGGGIKYELP